MRNLKTTFGGVLAAIGQSICVIDNAYCQFVGTLVTAIGVLFLGGSAADAKNLKK